MNRSVAIRMIAVSCLFLAALVMATSTPLIRAADEEPSPDAKQAAPITPKPVVVPDRAELEKQFAATLSGATMVGRFTVTGEESDAPLSEDRYTIDKVTKLENGDFWLFVARIQYEGRDVKVPLPVEVKWAGDTPVITVNKLLVPGLGLFTARVLIYDDQYAGTWSGGDHGGQMFGRIETAGSSEEAKPEAETTSQAEPTDSES